MIAVDFHSHTLFSGCGVHTHLEMLTHARNLGMQGLAITDHGPEVGRRFSTTFFDRLQQPVPGIKLLKGIEANLRGLDGEIDVPTHVYPYLDMVLLGFHGNTPTGLGTQVYTHALVRAHGTQPLH